MQQTTQTNNYEKDDIDLKEIMKQLIASKKLIKKNTDAVKK